MIIAIRYLNMVEAYLFCFSFTKWHSQKRDDRMPIKIMGVAFYDLCEDAKSRKKLGVS